MLERVEITSTSGELLVLALQDVSLGVFVKWINGLGPVKADLVSSKYAKRDGVQYQASRRESRNITMKLGLDSRYGGDSIADIREMLYNTLMPKSIVHIAVYRTNRPVVHISGRVETCEAPMFTKEPEMDVSIICFDPDFIDPIEVTGGAEAYNSGVAEYPIDYPGNSPTGMRFNIFLDAGVTSVGMVIYHTAPSGETSSMEFLASLQGYDQIIINTNEGLKSATLIRAGTPTSILYGISPESKWLQLEKGRNYIGAEVVGQQTYYEYSYVTKYGAL